VLFAGALRWTRSERASAAAMATSVPSEATTAVAPDSGPPRRAAPQPTSSATSSMRVISAPGPTRIGGPQ
jgi:hypothetical protein